MRTALRVLNSAVRNRLGMTTRPEVVTYLVTLRCNLKCQMCDVWKIEDYPEMNLDQIDRVFTDLGRLSVVRLSGGEPFLRKDMAEIIDIVRKRSRPEYIQINTNGMVPGRVTSTLESVDCTNLHIKVSIDAMGSTHDEVRGVEGAFDKTVATLQELVKLRDRLGFYLGVHQVIMRNTLEHIGPLRALCDDMGLDLISEFALDNQVLYEPTFEIDKIENEMKTFDGLTPDEVEEAFSQMQTESSDKDLAERLMRRYYLLGARNRLLHGVAKPNPPCVALGSHFRIMPDGNVPVCMYKPMLAGNIVEEGFEALWVSERTEELRRTEVQPCSGCWVGCEVQPNAIFTGDIARALLAGNPLNGTNS
jgi:MoaA/NifB/PqqE/SkfB family radical SAM enzyme